LFEVEDRDFVWIHRLAQWFRPALHDFAIFENLVLCALENRCLWAGDFTLQTDSILVESLIHHLQVEIGEDWILGVFGLRSRTASG